MAKDQKRKRGTSTDPADGNSAPANPQTNQKKEEAEEGSYRNVETPVNNSDDDDESETVNNNVQEKS